MFDFDIQRCTRRCHATDRELKAGETVFSVLVPAGSGVERLDYSVEGWPGPPEESLGWWKSILPEAGGARMHWAPNDVMLHYFEQLDGKPAQEDTRYVLALLLVRRRIVRVESTEKTADGLETLVLYCPRNEQEYRVTGTLPDQQRIAAIQDELAGLLQGPVA